MLRRQLLAEAFGTFSLVFAGTGAIVIDAVTGGQIGHLGVAITFGLVVLAMIDSLGDISGCHINPAVTLGFWAARRFPGRLVGPTIAAQSLGAVVASGTLRLLFPNSPTLGETLPAGPVLQSVVLEIILSFILMVVILRVAEGAKEKGLLAGLSIGAVITLEATFAGPISGASMNPARSLGPALVAGRPEHLWIYVIAPVIGAMAAVPLAFALHPERHAEDAMPAQEIGCSPADASSD